MQACVPNRGVFGDDVPEARRQQSLSKIRIWNGWLALAPAAETRDSHLRDVVVLWELVQWE